MSELVSLPGKVYPKVSIDSESFNSMSCTREFKILDGCTYIEYLDSYSGKSFHLSNVEIKVSFTSGNNTASTRQIIDAYPDLVDPANLSEDIHIPDFKRVMREDLYNPLLRRDIKAKEENEKSLKKEASNSTNTNKVDNTSEVTTKYDRRTFCIFFNITNDLAIRIAKLEEDNIKLRQQLNDLVNGQVPKDFSSNILEDLFEDKK